MKKSIKTLISALIFASILPYAHAQALLHDSFGNNTPFSELKGKWVLINYWASWCRTCVNEIPEFNRFYRKHQKDPVALYGVNFEALSQLEQKLLIKKLNIAYPSLLKDPGNDLNLGDIQGVPVTFIINPEGKLVKTLYGGQTVRSLNKALTQAQSGSA